MCRRRHFSFQTRFRRTSPLHSRSRRRGAGKRNGHFSVAADFDQFRKGSNSGGERASPFRRGRNSAPPFHGRHQKTGCSCLDDSLSSVDTYTEDEILKQLKQVMKNCTSIIVSHRFPPCAMRIRLLFRQRPDRGTGRSRDTAEKTRPLFQTVSKADTGKSLEKL